LSEDEKTRIRHEMFLRDEIHRELEKAKSPEKRHGVHPFLNSPFFLTAVCGLLASFISQFYVYTRARDERRLAQDNALREKAITLVSSVANDLPTYVSTMGSMRKLKLWLKTHKNSDEKDEIGRPRDDVDKDYREFFKLYLQARKASSILAEVRAYYRKETVLQLADEEERAVEAIEDAKTDDEVPKRMEIQVGIRKRLLSAMTEEIRKR